MADLFEGIVMAEQRFHNEGYQEGYAEGSHAGMAEGRRYGALHGARIGSEIGSYHGFALMWHCLLQKSTDEKSSKKIRALDSLIGMIQKFPYEDPTYEKLQEDLEKIRGKFKQIIQFTQCVDVVGEGKQKQFPADFAAGNIFVGRGWNGKGGQNAKEKDEDTCS